MRHIAKARAILIIIIVLISAVTSALILSRGLSSRPSLSTASSSQSAGSSQLSEISQLEVQLQNLTGVVQNLTAADLLTSLETHEMIGSESSYMGGLVPTPVPFNYLWIDGSVSNQGKGYAVDAGLYVAAYAADGTLETNITVPFTGATFGSDNATDAFVAKAYGNSSYGLEILDSGQTTHIGLNIFHKGVVANWTVTPVCWSYHPISKAFQSGSSSSRIVLLQNEITKLNGVITDLTTAKVEAHLGAKAYPATTQYGISYGNSLWIDGSVTNVGDAVAYNVGVHVVAYIADGSLEANMTVPLTTFPVTYNATPFQDDSPKLSNLNSGYGYDSYSSSSSQSIGITLYTQQLVSNWTITPVWTNNP